MKAPYGRLIMCHMIADTEEELIAMADRIKVARRWHQYAGTPRSHFDICRTKRALAIQFGAQEISWRTLGMLCYRRRITGELGNPETLDAWLEDYCQKKAVAAGLNSGNDIR
jgi:hypothetical protein